MKIFKPNSNKHIDSLPADDDFFNHSHGEGPDGLTLCSIASEEWGYIDISLRKRITCSKCLDLIRHCREYKL